LAGKPTLWGVASDEALPEQKTCDHIPRSRRCQKRMIPREFYRVFTKVSFQVWTQYIAITLDDARLLQQEPNPQKGWLSASKGRESAGKPARIA
jgi:hypothetical protein